MRDPRDNEGLMSFLRESADQVDADTLREMAFHEGVKDISGPVGALLRQISFAHNEFEQARVQYGTTEGEAIRISAVMAEASSLVEFLRNGGQL